MKRQAWQYPTTTEGPVHIQPKELDPDRDQFQDWIFPPDQDRNKPSENASLVF